MEKKIALIIGLLITLVLFSDSGIIITRFPSYYKLLLLEAVVFFVLFIFFTKKLFDNISQCIFRAIITTLAFTALLFPFINDSILIKSANKTKETIIPGHVISAKKTFLTYDRNRAEKYKVVYEFADGSRKDFVIPRKQVTKNWSELIDNGKILDNLDSYDIVYIIGQEGDLGISFLKFATE